MPDCLAGAVGVRVRVGIDPGHGGKSTGCVGGDLREASYVYDAAEALALELLRRGHTFALSRRRDECPWFYTRARRLRRCDAVVSLHVNANARESVNGWECYWHKSEDLPLARALTMHVPRELVPVGRFGPTRPRLYSTADDPATASDDWLQRPATVIRRYAQPACLVEFGFSSNLDDRAYLLSPVGSREVVLTVADGLEAYVT